MIVVTMIFSILTYIGMGLGLLVDVIFILGLLVLAYEFIKISAKYR